MVVKYYFSSLTINSSSYLVNTLRFVLFIALLVVADKVGEEFSSSEREGNRNKRRDTRASAGAFVWH